MPPRKRVTPSWARLPGNGNSCGRKASGNDLKDAPTPPDGEAFTNPFGWIAGTANANYEIKGPCPTEFWTSFWTSAEGTLQFDMKDGTLPHVSLGEDTEPTRVTRFLGQAKLHAGRIEIKDARLDSPAGKFQLSGESTLKGELDFKLATRPNVRVSTGYTISGTVA